MDENMRASYLERIGYEGPAVPTLKMLDELIDLHQRTVPFETVIINKQNQTPDTSIETLFNKIVQRRLGGYCFELNCLFEALLTAVGFNARSVFCRSVRGREGRMPINHRGIVVELDGDTRFVDVGFGGPMPASSLLLKEDEVVVSGGTEYVMRRLDESWWTLERKTKSKHDLFDDGIPERWQTELELCSARIEEQDFEVLNRAFSAPGVLFHDHLIVNLRTDEGHVGIKDNLLTIKRGSEKELVELADAVALEGALREYFGLAYDLSKM